MPGVEQAVEAALSAGSIALRSAVRLAVVPWAVSTEGDGSVPPSAGSQPLDQSWHGALESTEEALKCATTMACCYGTG